MIDQLITILGEKAGEYPALITALACAVFLLVFNQILNIFNAIFKWVGGYKWIILNLLLISYFYNFITYGS